MNLDPSAIPKIGEKYTFGKLPYPAVFSVYVMINKGL